MISAVPKSNLTRPMKKILLSLSLILLAGTCNLSLRAADAAATASIIHIPIPTSLDLMPLVLLTVDAHVTRARTLSVCLVALPISVEPNSRVDRSQ